MFKPLSNQREYSLVSEKDDALDLPAIPTLADDADADAIAAHAAAVKDRAQKLKNIRERSEWPTLIKPGYRASIFHFRQIPGSALDWWEGQREKVGAIEAQALLFRLALIRVENLGGLEVKFEHIDDQKLVTREFLDALYSLDGDPMGIGRSIIGELANVVVKRVFGGLGPLS